MVDKLEVFRQWFLDGGGRLGEHVELRKDSNHNAHLRVAEGYGLKPGSCIVSCPHALTLSDFNARDAMNSPLNDICFAAFEDANAVSSVSLLRFFLIEQLHLGTMSFWWPYIDILPDPFSEYSFDTPLYYSEDDLKWIHGTSLEHSTRKIEGLWRDDYAQGLQALRQEVKDRYPWNLYKWAASVISTRSFPGSALTPNTRYTSKSSPDRSPVLLPGLDLLNHNPTAKVTWQWTEEACCIATDVALASGDEIFNNYAPKSNEELILGYGFGLFRNSSDHCNLALGAMAVARIQTILNRRRQDATVSGLPQQNDSSTLESTERTSRDPSLTGVGWVRLNHYVHDSVETDLTRSVCLFSPKFLGQASLAFSNAREGLSGILTDDVDFATTPVSRNKLHTMSAITMTLQKQCIDIVTKNAKLPAWPKNERQVYAARYRRGQLLILRTVIQSIIANLRQLVGLDPSLPRNRCIVCLEHILKAGPKEFLQDFRAAMHAGLGTRNPQRIKRQNSVEAVFTLWLCGLWLWTLPGLSSEREVVARPELPTMTANWMAFVRATYGEESVIGRQWTGIAACEESNSLTGLCHHIVKAAVAKHPKSLYNCPEVNTHRLLWCLRVVREESFMCPDLEGDVEDENDELMLFLESGSNHAASTT
ncbi:MAG: hypothetical protein Q9225_007157 [Loekoesia sp. 1 TL-2023]